jgi:micrococcal nuclease
MGQERHMTRVAGLAVMLTMMGAVAAEAQKVTKVPDGDTIEIAGIGKVRLAGIIGSEPVVSLGPSGPPPQPRSGPGTDPPTAVGGSLNLTPDRTARNFLRKLVLGQIVRIEFDEAGATPKGERYAYVFLSDGTFVNAEMLREGRGRLDDSQPFSRLGELRAIETDAREGSRGIWAKPAKRP